MLVMTVLVMGGLVIFIKKKNPDNRRRTTCYSTKDVFDKEFCPHCKVKMKKTWNKETFNPLGMNTEIQRELIATPVYTCSKCGHKIEKNQLLKG